MSAPSRARPPIVGEDRSSHCRRIELWALAVAALSLHNIEELLLLPGWIARHPDLPIAALHGDQTQFGVSLVIVTAVVLVVAVVAVATRARWNAAALACLAYALILNAATHLGLSLITGSLMPGLVTGALVLVPAGLLIVRALPRLRWSAATVGVIVLGSTVLLIGSLALAAALVPLL